MQLAHWIADRVRNDRRRKVVLLQFPSPLGESIFTEADTQAQLRLAVQDAVYCHFDEGKSPHVIGLHFVRALEK